MIDRRQFLVGTTTAVFAGTAAPAIRVDAQPRLETTRIRLVRSPSICIAPLYLAEDLLRLEGFTDVEYVPIAGTLFTDAVAEGRVDVALNFVGPLVISVDQRAPVVILGGVHVGCFELFGTHEIRAVRDLKGRRIAVPGLREPQHVFAASILAHVGIDPQTQVTWVTQPFAKSVQLLADGKIDAFLGFPPEPQELRAKKIGRLLVDSAVDRPWSHYFCCLAFANRDFATRRPVATRRALRAILKAADFCAADPVGAAKAIVEKGYAREYDYALGMMKTLPYNQWRVLDHEDAIRFYALRLREAGMIKSAPQKILADGTDWRHLNELKRELKG